MIANSSKALVIDIYNTWAVWVKAAAEDCHGQRMAHLCVDGSQTPPGKLKKHGFMAPASPELQ